MKRVIGSNLYLLHLRITLCQNSPSKAESPDSIGTVAYERYAEPCPRRLISTSASSNNFPLEQCGAHTPSSGYRTRRVCR
jgi:hypothetical protein